MYGEDKALPYVVPSPNVRIQCPLALVTKVIETKSPVAQQAADDFARFLFTAHAQEEFGRVGFRPVAKLCKTVPAHMVRAQGFMGLEASVDSRKRFGVEKLRQTHAVCFGVMHRLRAQHGCSCARRGIACSHQEVPRT